MGSQKVIRIDCFVKDAKFKAHLPEVDEMKRNPPQAENKPLYNAIITV